MDDFSDIYEIYPAPPEHYKEFGYNILEPPKLILN